MFRDDRLTVEREVCKLVEGEVIYDKPLCVAKDVPCHLSVSLNNTDKILNVPSLISDYTLFLNTNVNFEITENDILYITTSKNQRYKLFAGEVKIYNQTVQVKCRQKKIIESKHHDN